MSAIEITAGTSTIPAGTYRLDPVHSSASFAVKHMVVATFRGRFEDFDATLTIDDAGTANLSGTVQVGSIEVKDENLRAHLGSPEFFDVERFPEIRFELRPDRDRSGRRAEDRRRPHDQGSDAPGRVDRHDLRARGHLRRRSQGRPDARDRDRPHPVRPELERAAAEGRIRSRRRRQAHGRARARARGGVAR